MKKVFVRMGNREQGYIPPMGQQQLMADALDKANIKNAFIGHYALKIFEITGHAKVEGAGINFSIIEKDLNRRVFVIAFGDAKNGWLPSQGHADAVNQWFEHNFPNCVVYIVPYFSNVSGDFIGEKGIMDLCTYDIECGANYEAKLDTVIVDIVALANNEIPYKY